MPRDKNSYEEKKQINYLKSEKEKRAQVAKENFDIDFSKINSTQRLKYLLWLEQDGKDIYTGEYIDLNELIKKNSNYDIDHIIPYSISFIDARRNKVITSKNNNKQKNNLSPYQWLSKSGMFENFKNIVDDLYEKKLINNAKRELLLFEGDPVNEMTGFIERNLVDTRYASSELLHRLQQFKKVNSKIYPQMKIKVITGLITDYVRYGLLKIQKDREYYHHHAIDATIVNFLGNNKKIETLVNWTYQKNKLTSKKDKSSQKNYLEVVDNESGEILTLSDDFKYELNDGNLVAKIRKQIDEKISNNEIKFSRQLVTRKNKQLANETIYSIKWNKDKTKGYKVIRLKLLIDDNKKLANYFGNNANEKEKLFIYQNDKKMYDILNSIYNNYIKIDSKSNPFILFMKDEYNIDNPKHIKINNQLISKLKLIGDDKEIDNLIVLSSHNNNAIMESLKALSIRIYKDDTGKYILIPINQKCLKFKSNELIIDENKLSQILKDNNISINKYIQITTGTVFISKTDNKLFYSNGGGNFKKNQLEIKSLFCSNQNYFKREQMQISLSTIIKLYDMCEVDELGNIYNRKEIVL